MTWNSQSLFRTLGVTIDIASRTYELALGAGGTVVRVDGMDSPLITVQYASVLDSANAIGSALGRCPLI